ncbi:T9SS type A sorting domain-containing protein [Polaribacter reichenbachii]|nr:T9SS type A sorting domain-containing protein [Polaribacter reichenbachii]
MKTKLHALIIMLLTINSVSAQKTTANVSMGGGYSNASYYKLSTKTEVNFSDFSWDIAFLRTSATQFGIRINDNQAYNVFEASNDLNDWDTIDLANEANWTRLHNSLETWTKGAFDNGSATYGWGEYNPSNHHVEGTVIFVIKFNDGRFVKFINEDYFGGYTFKYSTWNSGSSTWGEDKTVTIPNTNNPENRFNYYSIKNGEEVIAEPAMSDWDLKFTRYITEIPNADDVSGFDAKAGGSYYLVRGSLLNEDLEVAINDEPDGTATNPSLTYATEINAIGRKWAKVKDLYTRYVDPYEIFYVKYPDNTVYRLYFTNYEGSATGNITFQFKDVTAALGINDVSDNVSFGVYPNPSIDKQINLVYDINKLTDSKNEVSIYTITGKKIFNTSLKSNSGFYNRTLDLSNIPSGIYILKFNSGNSSTSKKLVLN